MAKKAYIGAKLLANLIPDGDFETTGWSGGARDSAHVKYGRYARKMTGSTSEFETTVSSTATIQLTPSHKYYVCIEAYQTAVSGSVDIYWPIAEPVMLSGQVLPKANQWCRISTVADRGAFSAGTYPIRFDYNNQNQAGTMWFDGAMLIDLTAAFGSGKEPTKEWCDAHIQFTAGGQVCCFDTANSAARQIKNMYIGVGGKARKVKKAYVGVGGKARLFYSASLSPAKLSLFSGTRNTYIKKVIYANGYWVALGYQNDGSYKVVIAYTNDLEKPWTVKTMYSGSNCNPGGIVYANGYWAVTLNTGSSGCRVYYSTSLDGTWNYTTVFSGGFSSVSDICYGNGYWVVAGSRRDGYASVAYSTSLTGTWSNEDLWDNSDYTNNLNCIAYANGYFVAGGVYSATSKKCYARIAYATDPNGSWTKVNVWESSYSGSANAAINGITYANGQWAVCGEYYKESSTYGLSMAYAAGLDGTWTTKDIWTGENTDSVECIAYADGYWMVGGHCTGTKSARISYSTNLNGTWNTIDVWTGTANTDAINDITYGSGYWLLGGEYYNGTSYAQVAYSPSPEEFSQL